MKNKSPQILRTKILAFATATLVAACILLCGSLAQAQSAISGVYPNGNSLFQAANNLSFTASSPAGVTNVTVQLTITSIYTGQSFVKNLTAANGLTITGPSTGLSVSAVLNSNTVYSAVIQVKDANGSAANQTVAFDTITPVYTWEAEDWNYGGGLFIDNPQTNAYAGLGTASGDAFNNNGGASYRPINPGLSTEPNGDTPRAPWIGSGLTDFDVGFTDGGDFGNYSRHYPAGTYNLFARVSGGNGPKTEVADVSVVSGTATISSSGSSPYQFATKGRGWQTYDYMPVTDNAGNLIQITFDGSASTLQVLQNQANDNMNFFMLMPLNTNIVASTVTITNVSPDGSALYNPAGTFSFTAASPSAPVDPNNITVQVTATNLWGHGSVSSLTSSSGLTITGPSTNLNVSLPTTTNTLYTISIQITDANGISIVSTISFDTIIPTYTFEAEDFDYQNGQFFDNPQTNAYNGFDGVAEVDFHVDAQHGGSYNRVGLSTENASDKSRPPYNGTGDIDYDVGFNDGGNWGNYTRHYPAGTYNIYVRASNGGGGGSSSLVTSGVGTSSQTLSQLGKWGVPPTGGWQTYQWVPVLNPAGALAQFGGGSLETLRMTIDGGNCNENFILLTPADPSVVTPPYVDSFQPDGSALFLTTNQLSFVVHSQPGTPTSNIGLNLNGANVSGMTFSGTANLRNVSYPVQANTYYNAIVTVTDADGTTKSTNSFSTFNSTNYQWEAEDYDYSNGVTGGLFFDNPQVGSYAGLGAQSGTDFFESDLAGPGRGNVYRLANGTDFPDAVAGDQPRAQFTNAGKTDYNLGSFGVGSWANYTRTYPAGVYFVMGRFGEGAGVAQASLSLLTNGVSTNFLGTFTIPNLGWGTWQWQQLLDNNGNPSKVTLDGNQQILRMNGLTANEVNVNFLMLVRTAPSPAIKASRSGVNIVISFPTMSGYSYQLQYKNNLTDVTWTSLGSAIAGNGLVESASDSTVGTGHRFYQVQVQ
jgi:hypothetical protein